MLNCTYIYSNLPESSPAACVEERTRDGFARRSHRPIDEEHVVGGQVEAAPPGIPAAKVAPSGISSAEVAPSGICSTVPVMPQP